MNLFKKKRISAELDCFALSSERRMLEREMRDIMIKRIGVCVPQKNNNGGLI